MNVNETNKTQVTVARQWSLPLVYKKEQIDSFWSQTDEETRSMVKLAAQPQDAEDFPRKIRRSLSKPERRYLSNCSANDLETLLATYLDKVQDKKEQHSGNGKGLKWARAETSKFLNNFNDYIQAYSGIIQIMNGAGQNYGDAAYGALSLLLVVAVNKEKTEDIIRNMLSALHDQYSRIQMLKEVYSTARIKEHIAIVYRLGIEFTHQATLYYSTGTFKRFLYLLSRPPSMALEGKVSDIKKAIKEMRMEMETLDRIRLHNVEVTVGNVQQSVEVLHVREENSRLESLQRLLKVEVQDLESTVREYDQNLTNTFGDLPRIPPFNAKGELFQRDDFLSWRDHIRPCFMLLQGKTVAPERTLLSWQSPATTNLVRFPERYLFEAESLESPTLVYCFCQVADYYDENPAQQYTACSVISMLIYQLLKSKNARQLLRNDEQHTLLKREIEDVSIHLTARPALCLSKLYSILAHLLTVLDLGNVFFVLDRVDRIQGNLEKFLVLLLEIVERSIKERWKCTLKIFVTIRTESIFDDSLIKENIRLDNYIKVTIDQG